MMLRKYGALFTYISLLCLPAAALLAFHWANVNVYGGALRTGMVDVAGALVIGVIAVHVPSREDGAFAWKRPASKSRLLGRAYALTAAALFVGSLAAAAAYRPGYTLAEAGDILAGAGYADAAPEYKLYAPDAENPFIEWSPVFRAQDKQGADVEVVFHLDSGRWQELGV